MAVTKTVQTKRGVRDQRIPGVCIFEIVVIKLIAPNNEEIPAKCKLNIAQSTEPPECELISLRGG